MAIKSNKLRFLAVILCLCMILPMFSDTSIFATDSDNADHIVTDWTWVDPYGILLPGSDYGFDDVDWAFAIPAVSAEYLWDLLPSSIDATLKSGARLELAVTWEIDDVRKYILPAELTEGIPEEELPHFYLFTATLPEGYMFVGSAAEPTVLVQLSEVLPLAEERYLLAEFTFDNENNRLLDTSGNGVQATIEGGNAVYRTENGNTYLDLRNTNGKYAGAYLSLDSSILNGLTEMTVEMRVNTDTTAADNSWPFFAGQSTNQYLGIFLRTPKVQTERGKSNQDAVVLNNWTDNQWHTIKIIFRYFCTELYIDDDPKSLTRSGNSLADCLGEDGMLWFGRSDWGEGFSGYIDYVRIWNYATEPAVEDEASHIITDGITDPSGTTVNMFDYWMTEQTAGDWEPNISAEQFLSGINNNHLFLFAGGNAAGDGVYDDNTGYIGVWNNWIGNTNTTLRRAGIVARQLLNGYPQLSVGMADWGNGNTANPPPAYLSDIYETKYNESLAYMFDPSVAHDGKASYPNVTGLFRMGNDGYYYFNSADVYAELNAEQTGRPKTSNGTTGGNRITLYDTTWKASGVDGVMRGQFFPFNDWSDLFYTNADGELTQTHIANGNGGSFTPQSKTDEPMNHYFGLSAEVKFQQPMNGTLNWGASGNADMTFEFSGDDDVWIFIDDVLVGDLGGIHNGASISINFSTGEIKYYNLDRTTNHTDMDTTIRNMFVNAGVADTVSWAENGNTFASYSIHTLKFFYLERGNNTSNCSIKYNLVSVKANRIRKVDESGEPLSGAEFVIFPAVKSDLFDENNYWHGIEEFAVDEARDPLAGYYEDAEKKILHGVISGVDGYAELVDQQNNPIDLSKNIGDAEYIILREINVPEGYRTNPDIVLQYHAGPGTFTVVNKHETGSYASFMAEWKQIDPKNSDGNSLDAYFAVYDPEKGTFDGTQDVVSGDALQDGLAIVVPLIKQADAEGNFLKWLPMYGSNTLGWDTVIPEGDTTEAFMRALVKAAILQISDDDLQDWYLTWLSDEARLEGLMQNLPGDASRYVLVDPSEGDLSSATLFISGDVLKTLGLTGKYESDENRYRELQSILKPQMDGDSAEDAAEAILDALLASSERSDVADLFSLLYTDNWYRDYRTVIYIPNEQRELRVRKVDQNGNYINGVVFAIFDTAQAASEFGQSFASAEAAIEALQNAANGVMGFGTTATVQLDTSYAKQAGILIFRENDPDTGDSLPNGYTHIAWPHSRDRSSTSPDYVLTDNNDNIWWLKEIYAPDGVTPNANLVRIEVGDLAIYANATGYTYENETATVLPDGADDGITVHAALGKLSQTLVQYAISNTVNVTLKDITIYKQIGSENGNGELDPDGWKDAAGESFNLHFGVNADLLTSQYGRHSGGDIANVPVFSAEDGYIRIMPRQNWDLSEYADDLHDSTARRLQLMNQGKLLDLNNLFGLMNIVVIENQVDTVTLELSKTVHGAANRDDVYAFGITLTPPEGVAPSEFVGSYHAYLHPTEHFLWYPGPDGVLGTGGTQNDREIFNEQAAADDVWRPCTPVDHVGDCSFDLVVTYDDQTGTYIGNIVSENGEQVVLKAGETYAILGLPLGTEYTITEFITLASAESNYEYITRIEVVGEENEQGRPPIVGDTTVSGRTNTQLVLDPDTGEYAVPSVKVAYDNTATVSGLSVEKQVEGWGASEAGSGEMFWFTVRLTSLAGGTLIKDDCQFYLVTGTKSELFYDYTWIQANNGEATVTFGIAHGQKFVIANLPVGAGYEVVESPGPGPNWRLASFKNEKGVIKDRETVEVLFVNRMIGYLTIKEDGAEQNESFLYKVTGTTVGGEKIELLVSVKGNGSTTIEVPLGDYVVEEISDWSWRYKNEDTKGDEGENWTVSADKKTASTGVDAQQQEKTVTYFHVRNDKVWLGGEQYRDNQFAP